jgi:hypothetical protein
MNRLRRLAAAVLAALTAAALAACGPVTPPSHYGSCPAGQHWLAPLSGQQEWECAR